MRGTNLDPRRRRRGRSWPWLVLALITVPAVWHVLDFPDDRDSEFPRVERPTFSRRPPPAYRLAEPGDTIDRVAIYVASGAVVLALAGTWLGRRGEGLWPSALAMALAALWHAATPGPTFDGWHGLGWRVLLDPKAPTGVRVALALAVLGLAVLGAGPLLRARRRWAALRSQAHELGIADLLTAAAVLAALRQFEIPGVEPVGYWPRWALVFGLVAFTLALIRAISTVAPAAHWRRCGLGLAGAAAWFALVAAGIGLTWYHRPLPRLRTVVPDRIYISAMPTRRGLEVAQSRHHFKTIINLFPEAPPLRSPRLPEELRFAEAHGIRYLGSPTDESDGGAFLHRTLALAQDPRAWPILVHCHGCMDRTPAWTGIYQFVVEGRPLAEILQFIERHRGYRPKASVTLLYNRVLPTLAPERYANDPTAALLRRCVPETVAAPGRLTDSVPASANRDAPPRVSRGGGRSAPLPNLTPSRRSLQYRKTLGDPHRHESAIPS